MDLKQIVMLAIKVSIFCAVFGFGRKATAGDLLYLVRRPGLLSRSLLSVFVLMPVAADALTRIFDLRPAVVIVVIALSISPVPPMLPKKVAKAGGDVSYGLGLMAILALVSIVAVPLALEILQCYFDRQLGIEPGAIAGLVFKAAIVPLAAGMIFRMVLPGIAKRLEKPVSMIGSVLMLLAVPALLYGVLPAVWGLTDARSVLTIVLFIVAGFGIGHFLGGPNPDDSVVLSLSTACRHPAIAIASANFPNQQFGGTVLLYLIVSAIVGALYIKWRRPCAGVDAIAA